MAARADGVLFVLHLDGIEIGPALGGIFGHDPGLVVVLHAGNHQCLDAHPDRRVVL